jgi:hypothetical protein
MPDRIKRQQFATISVILLLVFVFPLISIANKASMIAGIPVLFLYLFGVWLGAIGLLWFTAERKGTKNNPGT